MQRLQRWPSGSCRSSKSCREVPRRRPQRRLKQQYPETACSRCPRTASAALAASFPSSSALRRWASRKIWRSPSRPRRLRSTYWRRFGRSIAAAFRPDGGAFQPAGGDPKPCHLAGGAGQYRHVRGLLHVRRAVGDALPDAGAWHGALNCRQSYLADPAILLFALLGLSTAEFSLTWACAKEVNPPLLSGMSTSVASMGGFLCAAIMQPVVGWIMDLGWYGEMVGGARVYDVSTWQNGVLAVTLCAALGAAASWRIRETCCRNVWQAA